MKVVFTGGVFQWRSSSIEGCPPQKVVFHRRLSYNEGCLPPKVVLHQRASSTKGCPPPKVVFHWRLSFTEGCLPLKVIFPQRLSSTESCLYYLSCFPATAYIYVAFVELIHYMNCQQNLSLKKCLIARHKILTLWQPLPSRQRPWK